MDLLSALVALIVEKSDITTIVIIIVAIELRYLRSDLSAVIKDSRGLNDRVVKLETKKEVAGGC